MPREWACYDLLAGGRPLEAEDEEERVTEAINNDIEPIQRRIARSLARVHELKADPARLDLDQAARLIGRLTEQRNMLAKAPGGT